MSKVTLCKVKEIDPDFFNQKVKNFPSCGVRTCQYEKGKGYVIFRPSMPIISPIVKRKIELAKKRFSEEVRVVFVSTSVGRAVGL